MKMVVDVVVVGTRELVSVVIRSDHRIDEIGYEVTRMVSESEELGAQACSLHE